MPDEMKKDEVDAILTLLMHRDLADLPPERLAQRAKQWDRNPACPDCGSLEHFECP